MIDFFRQFLDPEYYRTDIVVHILKTIIVLLIIIIARFIYLKGVNKQEEISLDYKRKAIVNSRNFAIILSIIWIILVWGAEIKGYALSVAAIAVAITMSFKEMITNFMGGVSRTISRQYNIGDRIAIGHSRGDVIDISMLTTTILEIGPGANAHQYTGSSIVFPNSLLLNTPIVNESFTVDYQLHVFTIALKRSDDLLKHEKLLMEACEIVCTPYLNKARIYSDKVFKKNSVEPPNTDPRVTIIMHKSDEVLMVVRLPAPAQRKGRIEQEVIRRYLEMLSKEEKYTSNSL